MSLQIDLRKFRLLQWCMFGILIVQTTVTFSALPFLQIFSYLSLGLSFLAFFAFIIVYSHRPQLTLFDLLCVVYFILLITFSFIGGTAIKEALFRSVELFLFVMLVNFYRDDLSVMLKTCCTVFSLCIYGNLLEMIMFPEWVLSATDYIHSFLLGGNYNQMGPRFLCAIVTNILCLKLSRKWWINLIPLIIVSLVTLAIVGSKTSMACIIVFLLAAAMFSSSINIKRLISSAYFILYLLFQFFVVFSGKGLKNNQLAVFIIEDVLQKDLTFTKRTDLWELAGNLFSHSPIIGYGFADTTWYLSHLSSNAIGPHNFLYSILLQGGLVLMCVFVAILATTYYNFRRHIDNTTSMLMLSIVTMLFMQLMEVYPIFFTIYLMILINYYPYISKLWEKPQQTASSTTTTPTTGQE